jgi:hypothetical protein
MRCGTILVSLRRDIGGWVMIMRGAIRGFELLGIAIVMAACGSNETARTPPLSPTPAATPSSGDPAPALSQDQIALTTERELGALQQCGMSGQSVSLMLTLIVNKRGDVASVLVSGDGPSHDDPALASCVETQAARWKFPSADRISILRLPFRFVGTAS